jgi:CelD/BcsL family acetyltransferase involved in cellulose biosynthesis
MNVRVIESDQEFVALEATWERLQSGAVVTSVFASYDWQHLWWKTYGAGRPLRLLVATSGDEVVGILPLYVATETVLGLPVRLLRFVGTGGDTSPDDLGPVLAPEREGEVARALADAVMSLEGWDVLQLHDMQPSAFTPVMEEAARGRSLPCRTGRSERISFLTLPATWDAWLASLHRDRRYRVKKMRKDLLAAHPDARFFAWSDAATLDAGIDRLIHLHHTRWNHVGQSHGFSSEQYVGFHRAVMQACFARDRLQLCALELGGQIVAMFYLYRFRGVIYLMQAGFDPAFAKLKPGLVLLGWIVEDAIRQGCTALDFLKGEHRYKDELANGERSTVYLSAFRARPAAWIYRLRRVVAPAVKARVLAALGRTPDGHGHAAPEKPTPDQAAAPAAPAPGKAPPDRPDRRKAAS